NGPQRKVAMAQRKKQGKKPPSRKASSGGKKAKPKTRRSSASSIESARAAWSGNLHLALVSFPVKIFPATQPGARIQSHQVHEPSGKRIRYQKIVPEIGAVDTDDIVKGFEIEKGRYILLDPGEIENLKLEARRTFDIVQFVKQGEIDPL